MLRVDVGLDRFVNEKHYGPIAAILAGWSAGWQQSPDSTQAIAQVLGPGFLGCSFHPAELKLVRPGPPFEVHRVAFNATASLSSEAFLRDCRAAFSGFSKIVTAELQVTRIDADLRTRVRYEFVGTGSGFYREQRTGFWEWPGNRPLQGSIV